MVFRRWLYLLVLGPACASPGPVSQTAPAVPGASATATDRDETAIGVHLVVVDAPDPATLVVEASDSRPPLIAERALAGDQQLALEQGFVSLTMRAGDDTRLLEFYMRPGAEVRYDWTRPHSTTFSGAQPLDRARAEAEAKKDFDALMAAMRDPARKDEDPPAIVSTLAAQRRTVEALDDDAYGHLCRLLHASNAIQIAGPEDAWSVIASVPRDSVAWAAYSDRFVELRSLFGDAPEPAARFEQVRVSVTDPGLAAAFKAGDLYAAERSGKEDALAKAYVEATVVGGPPVVGEAMPAFEFISVEGRVPVRSSDLLGKPYLLELWSTWCKPCLEQMEELHRLHEDLGGEASPRLRLVSVAVNETREPIATFRADRWPMPWTNVWLPDGKPLFVSWSINQVPYAVLVDAHGKVLKAGAHVEFDDVRAAAGPR